MGGDDLCPCFHVTKKDVRGAVRQGAASFKEVKKAAKLGKGCGHCKCKAKKYVKKQLRKAAEK